MDNDIKKSMIREIDRRFKIFFEDLDWIELNKAKEAIYGISIKDKSDELKDIYKSLNQYLNDRYDGGGDNER